MVSSPWSRSRPRTSGRCARGGSRRELGRAPERSDDGGQPSCLEAKMKVLVKSAWGSDDPTKAAFAFLHANALAEAGHEAQIFLLGEAVSLLRDPVANAVVPVGWPPLSETFQQAIRLEIPIHV